MALDTSGLADDKYKSFVESAYREDFEKRNKSQRDRGIWDGVWADNYRLGYNKGGNMDEWDNV